MSWQIRTLAIAFALALPVVAVRAAVTDAPPAAAQAAFFESKIRPLLVDQCYRCHSAQAKKLKGHLLLDTRDGLLKGGDSGPAIVPGDPDHSRLIEAVRYGNKDTAMPPKSQLPPAAVADLEAWVRQGAPWPQQQGAAGPSAAHAPTPAARKVDYDAIRKTHWAYQPIAHPKPPTVRNAAWCANDIDRLILAPLEARHLQPAPPADRMTLVRRLYFDLAGLPPTPEQIDAFVNDASPDAYEKLVDQLLASPHFGERWGRHWLDVARFGESLTLRGFVLSDAWRYRDYVIESFNADRPFDHFMQEQVAGDLMPATSADERRRQMTGTSFLAIGNNNLEEQDKQQLRMDVVDEQLECVGRAFLAQTIGCARCHDHKFDPIPTADYYALAGILRNTRTLEHANVSKWMEVPLPADPAREAELTRQEAAVAALQAQVKLAKAAMASAKVQQIEGAARKAGRPVVIAPADLPGVVVDDAAAHQIGAWRLSTAVASYIGEGYLTDDGTAKGERTLTFQPNLPHAGRYEVRFAYTPATNRDAHVPVTVFTADGEKTVRVNEKKPPAIDGRFVSLGQFNFERNGQEYVLVSNEGTTGHVVADAVQFIPVDEVPAAAPTFAPHTYTGSTTIAAGTLNVTGPPATTGAATQPETQPSTQPAALTDADVKRLEEQLKKLTADGPRRDKIDSVVEEPVIEDAHVHVRGNVHNLGPEVPRGFLTCVPVGHTPALPKDQSGRLQLSQWLADRDNPLPARVTVNRAWNWLFGQGIVRTVDNFGTTGEAPSNVELLDYLAARFVAEGWSTKKLVRTIVLSQTYQQSGKADATGVAADPENRLFGRANRRRLDAECLRDAMLLAAGRLDLTPAGLTHPAALTSDYGYKPTDTRRSVYVPAFRNALPDLFEVFDVADPSTPTGRRNVSTVAPQALFLMNHPFVQEQAKAAAEALLADASLADDDARLAQAYRRVLGRAPTAGERRVVGKFLGAPGERREAWTQVFHALFASLDFRYVE